MSSGYSVDDRAAQKLLSSLITRFNIANEEATYITNRVYLDIQEHFSQESSPQGKWIPSIRARRTGGKTLTLTGNLRNSLYMNKTAVKDQQTTISWSSAVVYAKIHNFGGMYRPWGKKKWKQMPKREYAWVSPQAKYDISNFFLRPIK